MTRRDRAAMVLAYEGLRVRLDANEAAYRAQCVLTFGDDAAYAVSRAHADAWNAMRKGRVRRARLALLLRVLLRADAEPETLGGRWACVECGSTRYAPAWFSGLGRSVCRDCTSGSGIDWTYRIRPLWELARRHKP